MSGRWRRFALALAGGVLLGGTAGGAVRAVPASWTAYAASVNTALSGWLSDDSPETIAFRRLLDAERPASDAPSPPRIVRIWLDQQGRVTRAVLAEPATADESVALSRAVVGRHIDLIRPRRIPMPLRLEIQLQPGGKPPPDADEK